jgi:hypothetical protein
MAALTAPQISLLQSIVSHIASLTTADAITASASKGGGSPESKAAHTLTGTSLTTLASQMATVAGGG